VYFIGS